MQEPSTYLLEKETSMSGASRGGILNMRTIRTEIGAPDDSLKVAKDAIAELTCSRSIVRTVTSESTSRARRTSWNVV